MSNAEKRSCDNCAFFNRYSSFVDLNEDKTVKNRWFPCNQESHMRIQINEEEINTKSCRKFVKRKFFTGKDRQLQECNYIIQLHSLREHNKVSNRFKRNWDKVIGLTIALTTTIITILKLVLGI